MRRPSFQFYPGDWLGDTSLRRCTAAERGIWIDVLCHLHQADEYGVLRWPLADIARAVGCKRSELMSLVTKNVLRGTDVVLTVPLVYVPRSGRKDGTPVPLIAAQPGPIWFSKRMVIDEYIRTVRGEGGRFGEASKAAPKPPFGDGASASASTSASPDQENGGSKSDPPALADLRIAHAERVSAITQDAIDAYNATVAKPGGLLPRVNLTSDARKTQVRRSLRVARAICERLTGSPTVTRAFWDDYFAECARDDHKSGRLGGGREHPNWLPDFKYLTRPDVIEEVFDAAVARVAA